MFDEFRTFDYEKTAYQLTINVTIWYNTLCIIIQFSERIPGQSVSISFTDCILKNNIQL